MSAIDTIAASIEHHVRQHHPPHKLPALRDAHPKHHGCVRAEFIVAPHSPELELFRHGVFARPGHTYHAWVRFSNALKERHDLAPDARGMAVKLMAVEESASGTQDFLMVSHHVFFARHAEEFIDFPATVSDVTFKIRAWVRIFGFFINPRRLRLRLRGLFALLRSLKPTWSPLAMEYASQVPYKLGPGKWMKYSVRPHEPRPWWRRLAIRARALTYLVVSNFGGMKKSHNLLREALMRRLRDGDARFDFCVQVRDVPRDPRERERIENDAVMRWSEWEFPRHKIAEIRILRLPENHNVPVMMSLGQHLSYTPWHNVPDHEPVGSINAARKVAYERISALRHELNRKQRREPLAAETPEEYVASLEWPS
jgi:Catalase